MLGPVVGIPKLRGDPQLVPGDLAGGDCRGQAHSRLSLVAIITGRIEVSVTELDRGAGHVGRFRTVDLPQPQADARDGRPVGQTNRFTTDR